MHHTYQQSKPSKRHNTLIYLKYLSNSLKQNKWKDWRVCKGIQTQLAFSNLTGFSASWISKIENGVIAPDIIQYIWLAQNLGLGASINNIYESLLSG